MAIITVPSETRERTILIDGISRDEMRQVIEAGLASVFGADLPADFLLDDDDTLTISPIGVAGVGVIYSRNSNYSYKMNINETE